MKHLLLGTEREWIHIDVLEWGSGNSTIYYSEFLDKANKEYSWTSLEYNAKWSKYVSEAVCDNDRVEVVLFDVGNTKLSQRRIPMDEYVSYPSTLGKKFDFILVDGRKRRRCLIEASKLLKPRGLVVLHDAQRKYYQCAFSSFKRGEFFAHKFWVGNQ